MEYINKTLDAFFSHKEANVLVLKGDWGVGKTYFWKNYIDTKIKEKNLSQIAYSYISLFGNNSLQDVRKNIFRQARPISIEKADEAINNGYGNDDTMMTLLWKKTKDTLSTKVPIVSGLGNVAEHLPMVNKYANVINALEYNLVNNYVVCIDDIERKGTDLSVKEIMGWVDELSQQKSCKVILIFNEKSFDNEKDKKDFNSYREKIVDYEVTYSPTHEQNINYIFDDDFKHLKQLQNTAKKLGLKNIRVLKKIKWTYDFFQDYLGGFSQVEVAKFISNLIIHCVMYFEKDEALSYQDFLKYNDPNTLAMINVSDAEITLEQKRYQQLVDQLNFSTSEFGEFISFFIQNGYVDEEDFNSFLNEFRADEKVCSIEEEYRSIWDEKYSNSFDDNFLDFRNCIVNFINNNIENITFRNFNSAIEILEKFEYSTEKIIDLYIAQHLDYFKTTNMYSGNYVFCSKSLKEKAKKLYTNNQQFNIDDVALYICEQRGWSDEIILFLDSLTEENYYDWMKRNPDEMVRKIRGGLLQFSPSDSNSKCSSVGRKVHNTLKKIASENTFNAYRIKHLYNITIED